VALDAKTVWGAVWEGGSGAPGDGLLVDVFQPWLEPADAAAAAAAAAASDFGGDCQENAAAPWRACSDSDSHDHDHPQHQHQHQHHRHSHGGVAHVHLDRVTTELTAVAKVRRLPPRACTHRQLHSLGAQDTPFLFRSTGRKPFLSQSRAGAG
jgi:hypothetical protein